MATQIFNLIFAAVGSLAFLSALAKGSGNWDRMSLLVTFINFCWLLSAISLFFRSRLAWCGSVLGVSVMFAGSVTMLFVGMTLVPVAHDPTDGAGYAIVIGFFGVLLSVPVLVGLLRLRRKWSLAATAMPNEAPQATAAPWSS